MIRAVSSIIFAITGPMLCLSGDIDLTGSSSVIQYFDDNNNYACGITGQQVLNVRGYQAILQNLTTRVNFVRAHVPWTDSPTISPTITANWLKIVSRGYIFGNRTQTGVNSLATGTFSQIRVVMVSSDPTYHGVSCSGAVCGLSGGWQCCAATAVPASFELVVAGVTYFTQPNYYTLNSACITPANATANIVCTFPSLVNITTSQVVTTTWAEPNSGGCGSCSDNAGYNIVDVYGLSVSPSGTLLG